MTEQVKNLLKREFIFEPGTEGDVLRLLITPFLARVIIRDLSKWVKGHNAEEDKRLFSMLGKLKCKEK